MGLPIVVVDAFTDTRFRGNPAAVCVLPEGRDDQFMKDVAREMNLSETAFLLRDGYLVEVASEDIVRKAVPNHPLLAHGTARSRPTGASGSARARWSGTRRRRGAEWCACGSTGIA